MSIHVEAPGAGRLARDLERAADELDTAGLVQAVAEPIARRAAAEAPRRTGATARSVHVDATGVAVDTPYAVFPHWGTKHVQANPFLTRQIRPSEITRTAEKHLDETVHIIEGNTYV